MPALCRYIGDEVVARRRMTHGGVAGIVPEDTSGPPLRIVGSVGDDYHAAMLRIAHASAAAMVERYPGGAGCGVEEGVEKRPVGNGVGSGLHSLGIAIGAGDRAAVEVVAADDDWRLQLAS